MTLYAKGRTIKEALRRLRPRLLKFDSRLMDPKDCWILTVTLAHEVQEELPL